LSAVPRSAGPARGDWLALLLLCAAIAAAIGLLLDARLYDLHVPIAYWRDGLSHGLIVKTIVDMGWYPVHTPWVGAPFGADFLDYPFSDGLNFLLLRLIAFGSDDWVVVQKLFYLAAYFLSGGVAFFVMRKLGVGAALAAAGALLFVLLPYHWARPWHLLLGSYAVVALGVWLAYVAWQGGDRAIGRPRAWLVPALVAFVVGCGGAYYAFFTAYLVLAAGGCRALAERSLRALQPAAIVVAAITIAVALNVAPSFRYRLTHGPNAEIAVRSAADSENYGLRLSQLVVPITRHRVASWAELARRYTGEAPLVNENSTASIGVAGTLGLVLLAVVLVRRLGGGGPSPRPPPAHDVPAFLALIVLAAFVLGTIGGLGTVFAYTVSPLIRAYNRISVFIGFAALTALVLALQGCIARAREASQGALTIGAALVVGLFGALDLTPASYPPPPPGVGDFASDRAFVRAAEAQLAPQTMVWQLPFQPFPEALPGETKLESYGQLRGYLNSTTLRWSYGAMRGRAGDEWARALASRALADQVDIAARSGFGAIYVDRRGYDDGGTAVEAMLRALLGGPIAQSADHHLAMYRLPVRGNAPVSLDAIVPPVDSPIRFDSPILSPLVAHMSGVSGYEPWGRWTEGGTVVLELARTLPARFSLRIATATAMPDSLHVPLGVRIGDTRRTFVLDREASVVEIPFAPATPARLIEITIPDPRSPQELGINTDARKLGIGLESIAIVPTPAAR
jgi:phosphoglycerol transferase